MSVFLTIITTHVFSPVYITDFYWRTHKRDLWPTVGYTLHLAEFSCNTLIVSWPTGFMARISRRSSYSFFHTAVGLFLAVGR